MKTLTYVALLASICLFACGQGQVGKTSADIVEIQSQLDEIEATLSSGLPIQTVNLNYLEFFADELVLLPPGQDAVYGRDAALAFYNDAFDMVTAVSVTYQSPEIIIDGNIAARRYVGNSKFQLAGVSGQNFASGRYVDILQKQPDGEWRIVWHAWTRLDQ